MNSAWSAWRTRLALLATGAVLLAGCASLPPGSAFPRPASNALTHPEATRLGRQLAAQSAAHAGLSGFRLLPVGIDSFQLRMEMAQRAERTLDVQYFVIENDDTGKLLQEGLLQAADRGVRVRLLIDDEGSLGREAQLKPLATHPNIELRVFNPAIYRGPIGILHDIELVCDATRLNYRMHNKLFVVDNEVGIIGGRNIGDAYFQEGRDFEFGDYDVIAAGPIVKKMSASFDAYWNSPLAIPIQALFGGKSSPEALAKYRDALASHHAQVADKDYVQRLSTSAPLRAMLAADSPWVWAHAEVIYDSPDKAKVEDGDEPGRLLRHRLGKVVEATRSELLIVSPYVVPGDSGLQFLQKLRQRGLQVQLLTNSLASTDMPVVHSGYQAYRIPLLEMGVELYEVRPILGQPVVRGDNLKSPSAGQFALHAKVFVFDRQRVFVGSMNLDRRSLHVNTEIGVIIDSPELARQIATRFAAIARPSNSYVLGLDDSGGRPSLVWRTLEGGKPVEYHQEPATSVWRRMKVDMLSMLPLDELL
ncbi:MAG: phospholipase D-like domain-containing protein [Casimicrobiaceae bacterium]